MIATILQVPNELSDRLILHGQVRMRSEPEAPDHMMPGRIRSLLRRHGGGLPAGAITRPDGPRIDCQMQIIAALPSGVTPR